MKQMARLLDLFWLLSKYIYFLFLDSLINCVSPTLHVGKPYKQETEWHSDHIL